MSTSTTINGDREHVLLAIYHRDESGVVTYRGLQEWPSIEDFEREVSRLGKCETRTEQMQGWPDATVHWLIGTSCAGDTGYKLVRRIAATY